MIIANETTVFDSTMLRVKKINRTQHVVIGYVDIHVDLGDDYEV